MSKLFEVLKNYLPQSQEYADDTQLYLSFNGDSACSQNDAIEALWNSLPASVRDIDNFLVFKRTIKTYLFKKAFTCYS